MFLLIINYSFYLLLIFGKIFYLTKNLNLTIVNPLTIAWITTLPVELAITLIGPLYSFEKPWNNYYYIIALSITNLVLFFDFILMIFSFRLIKNNKKLIYKFETILRLNKLEIKTKRMQLLANIFLIIFFILFFLLASQTFGVISWILDPRTGYQLHRVGYGPLYAFAMLFLSLSFVLHTIYSANIIKLSSLFILFLPLVYLFGSKGFIIQFIIYFCIILWFNNFKYIKSITLLLIFTAFLIALINFSTSDLNDVFSYFSHYANSAMYFESYLKGEIDLFYGQIWLTDFYKYLPRALFPDKPYVYGFLNVNEFFFPGAAEATNTPAFGGYIHYYADFGLLGVIVSSLINIPAFINYLLTYLLFREIDLDKIKKSKSKLYLFIWLFAPAFMTLIPTFVSLILFLLIVNIISVINRLKY
jgi:hypothetical protein